MSELNAILTQKAVNKVETLRRKQLNRRKLIQTIKNIKTNRTKSHNKLKRAI